MKKRVLFLFLSASVSMASMAYAGPVKKVVAGPESTVYGIAYEHGILTHALIAANNLKPPYTLHAGQVLIIPSPNEHIAGQGETLKSIADEYGVDVDVLAQENDARGIKQGERLMIPSRDTEAITTALKPPVDNISTSSLAPLPSVKSVTPAKSGVVTPTPTQPSHALPDELAEELAREKGVAYEAPPSDQPVLMGNLAQGNAGAPTAATTTARVEEVVEKPKKEIKKTEKKKTEDKKVAKKEDKPPVEKEEASTDGDQIQFSWPVQGKVVNKYSPGKNDGINIKVAEGTPIKAAADGKVHYAGNEVPGLGNLLLIKHDGGWITVYAYNSSLLVKKDATVKRGQVIAKSGKTGNATEPQLHFEVRKGKQPIDPLTQLKS